MHRTRTILVLFTACLTCAPAALATPELSPLPVGPAIPLPAPSPPPVVAAEQPGQGVETPHPQDGLPGITFVMPVAITRPPAPTTTATATGKKAAAVAAARTKAKAAKAARAARAAGKARERHA